MWRYDNGFLINDKGKVLEVDGCQDVENRVVSVANKKGDICQQFDLIYADEYPEEPKKGELNKEFGFYVERPFYIISEMSSNRYIQVLDGKKLVIKTANGLNEQVFYFDQTSKTIKSK